MSEPPTKEAMIAAILRDEIPSASGISAGKLIGLSGEEFQNLLHSNEATSERAAELRGMSLSRLAAIYEPVRLRRVEVGRQLYERGKVWNQPVAEADLGHWSRIAVWTVDQGTALLLLKDPDQVFWSRVQSHTNMSDFAKRYSQLRQQIEAAGRAGELRTWELTPGDLCSWASARNIEVPPALKQALEENGNRLSDLRLERDEARRQLVDAQASVEELSRALQISCELANSLRLDLIGAKEQNHTLQAEVSDLKSTNNKPREDKIHAKVRTSIDKMLFSLMTDNRAELSDEERVTKFTQKTLASIHRCGLSLDDETVRARLREAQKRIEGLQGRRRP